MACLSKHGKELARIEYINRKRAWFADGNVLENKGFGWKIAGKVKPGFNPADVAARRVQEHTEKLATRPTLAEYRKFMLHWKLADRVKILLCFDLLGDDIDGIWSELNDGFDSIEIGMDEIQEIAALQRQTKLEAERMRETAQA